jgi:hypothetical protein
MYEGQMGTCAHLRSSRMRLLRVGHMWPTPKTV